MQKSREVISALASSDECIGDGIDIIDEPHHGLTETDSGRRESMMRLPGIEPRPGVSRSTAAPYKEQKTNQLDKLGTLPKKTSLSLSKKGSRLVKNKAYQVVIP